MKRSQLICSVCGQNRTLIRIRETLGLPQGVDVLRAIEALRALLDATLGYAAERDAKRTPRDRDALHALTTAAYRFARTTIARVA